MKKLTALILILPLAMMLISCGGGAKKADMEDVPGWYLNPPEAEDAIFEAGDATKKSMALAKDAADSRARQGISQALEVKVENMVKDFMQESGVGEDAEALEFTSSVSKQVANNVLQGCKITKREMKTEGDSYHAYSLAKYELNSLIQETLNQARNNKALYNEAKANMAFDELEKEIENLEATKEQSQQTE